jgi:hypothetical protein
MKKAIAKASYLPHLPPHGVGIGTLQEMGLQVAEVSLGQSLNLS